MCLDSYKSSYVKVIIVEENISYTEELNIVSRSIQRRGLWLLIVYKSGPAMLGAAEPERGQNSHVKDDALL